MKAKIRNTELYFDVAGMHFAPTKTGFETRPILFMLHGGPGGDHLRFKQHSLELQDAAQLVFIDHRGSGQSKKSKQKDYSLENNIEDIEALRKHLGLEKISLLGTSYGGVVAQGYAIRYPQHLEKLILVVTAPSYHFIDEAKAYLEKHASKKQINASKNLWEGSFKNPKHVADYFKVMESMYSTSKKRKDKIKNPTVWSHEAINEGFGKFLRTYDYTKQLKKLSCPTLVLAGEKDWICNPNQSKIIAKHIPNAKLKIFKNAGHSLANDAHDEYIKVIKRFLKV